MDVIDSVHTVQYLILGDQYVQRNQIRFLDEINNWQQHGFKEVILSGIHTASYGLDLEGNINLVDIIEEIEKLDGIERVRIGSIEPAFFTQEVIEKIKG